jgi:malonyl-CoA O-methyltransferase
MINQPAKPLVARSFGGAAAGYDAVAVLQRAVGGVLLEKLPARADVRRILDVGAGTGVFSAVLAERHPQAEVIAVDIAEGMLRHARKRFSGGCVGGDAEALPFAGQSADLIFSSLAIQWCGCPKAVFREFSRVLRPAGHLLIATFGPQTLRELRAAWASVDDLSHVNDFASFKCLQEALSLAGFQQSALETTVRRLDYPGVMDLLRELKGLGARNLTPKRPRHLVGKRAWAKMMAAYPREPAANASIRASFEIITGSARLREG